MVSDQTTLAVANLTAIEHDRHNMRALRVHLDLLKHMAAIRGGIGAMREDCAFAANFVLWISMIAMDGPQNLPDDFFGPEELPPGHLSPPEAMLYVSGSQNLIEFRAYEIDEETSYRLLESRLMSKHSCEHVNSQMADEAVAALSHLCSVMNP
ncbi:hypothetical protein MMC08_004138 [Hypocenomyce scalaris]|nr:hypothetical protein [Hypocenomyce scalaris]